MTNRRYGKLRQDNTIEYAPRIFKENGIVVAPRIDDDEAYHSRGWFTILDIKPEYDPATKMLSLVGWTRDDQLMTLIAQYDIVDHPAPSTIKVRRFSKLKLVEFCMEQGIWQELKDFLEEAGYYDLFVMAAFFLENDKFFKAGLKAYKDLKVSEGADPEEIQATIDAALDFAFDDYETVEAEEEQSEQTEEL